MARMFDPTDVDLTWTDDELRRVVRRLGYTRSGLPTLWGHGFVMWFYSGGREKMAHARREMDKALLVVEAGISA